MATPDNAMSSAASTRRSRGIERGASDGRRDAIDIEIKRRDRMTRRANKHDKYFIVLSACCYRARESTIVTASGNPRTMSPRLCEGATKSKIRIARCVWQKLTLDSKESLGEWRFFESLSPNSLGRNGPEELHPSRNGDHNKSGRWSFPMGEQCTAD